MKAEYIDHMGSDLTVVNAARVSFNKESSWEISEQFAYDTYKLSEKDAKLIRYLAKHNHWTPFGHCVVTCRETVPIFVARQRFKHTVGFVYNEVSRRYVDDDPEFYTPQTWRKRADNVKQGSSDDALENPELNRWYRQVLLECEELYRHFIDIGVAPEQARMVLPQSMYTSYYVTGSLAAWARASNLRSDAHAQKEIRDLADQWNTIINPLFPVSWKELTQHA